MIVCHHIKKAFHEQKIFDDFSYTFQDHGFYLLFGPSGCGKTTLLNIISGVWSSDEGEVAYQGDKAKDHQEEFAYITQDSYFIDYLDVMDNLRLCCSDDEAIITQMKAFGLEYVLHQYPGMLSGGEKQRIAIIRALLLQSRVILLDEPSSALDEENTKNLLILLSEIKKDVCIICVSHDPLFQAYCDEWIDFLHLENYTVDRAEKVSQECEQRIVRKQRPLFPFIKKQAHYYKENRKVSLFLFLLLLVMVLICTMFINPEDKIIRILGNQAHANVLSIRCELDKLDDCLQLQNKEAGIKDIVYNYAEGATYYEQIEEKVGGHVSVDIPYIDSLISWTLPQEPSFFALAQDIAYGTYAEEKDEIMLGFSLAQQLGYDHLEEAIGKELGVLTAHGEETFVIAGIYSMLSDEHTTYVKSLHKNVNNLNHSYYFTKEYAKAYLYDDQLSLGEREGKASLYVYFDSFEELWKFEQQQEAYPYMQVISVLSNFRTTIERAETITKILLPFLAFLLGVILLFYIFVRMIQMKYTKHLLYVYELCHYSSMQIAWAMLRYYAVDITKLYLIACIISVPVGFGFNWLNQMVSLLYFAPYAWDSASVFIIYLLILVFTSVFFIIQFYQLQRTSAYDALRERRDLF